MSTFMYRVNRWYGSTDLYAYKINSYLQINVCFLLFFCHGNNKNSFTLYFVYVGNLQTDKRLDKTIFTVVLYNDQIYKRLPAQFIAAPQSLVRNIANFVFWSVIMCHNTWFLPLLMKYPFSWHGYRSRRHLITLLARAHWVPLRNRNSIRLEHARPVI